ncbi:type II toxin-antitoxin system VapC family toxin [Aliirhizobium terrae]|uniref:type II toxin-antitoxin system VapC family toxin n=1 Tax=Terrirhizobium terrae TaxID=2926709 RepID=UPI002578CCF1|nr:type II toxin-antitoxin system VapC family toxin [Rhizobium sp. CC-CFT758]WJH40290.1 type II toxin-antitoxin system VapC family toxin [Rhizobium sp. CC-CFT758]
MLDTNVVSSLSPVSGDMSDGLARWLRVQSEQDKLFLSVVTIHEISKGITLLKRKGANAKADRLGLWLDTVKTNFSDRLIPFDAESAIVAGELEADALSRGFGPGMADAMIAATAKLNGLTVVTRNLRHFKPLEIDVISPLDVSV